MGVVVAVAVALAVLVSSDRAFAANTLIVGSCSGATFSTIQAAVTASAAGDTIQVCDGNYTEQVVIPAGKNNLTLESQTPFSATASGAIIKAPANLPPNSASAIVEVQGATGVTIRGFTVSGPSGVAGCGCFGYGVLVDPGSSVTVTGNHLKDIRTDPFSGDITGWAIRANGATLTATKNTIDGYQRAGIDIRGAGSVGTVSDNVIRGAGPTSVIGQNGIVITGGASATVTGNTMSGNVYQPAPASVAGILAIGPVGDVTISDNKLLRNDGNIYVYNVSGNLAKVSGNTTTDGNYGIIVDASTGVVVDKNAVASAAIAGLNAGPDAAANTFTNNLASGSAAPGHDCLDESKGSATAGTANTWTKNVGDTRSPDGICTEAPVDENVPPVIVLPPAGAGPPVAAGPPGQEVGNEIIEKMRGKQLRTCVLEVRALGPSRALIARGVAHAPAKGTGRLVVRIKIKPKGKVLLLKNFGGVVADVRALCRSTSGVLHAGVRRVRVVLLIEHRLTPPGSWVPDQPILTGIGNSFMGYLRHRMFAVRFIECNGYTATWAPSPAFPPTLSLNRAKRVCHELKRTGGAKARVRLIPHGLTNPIATNSTESGRRVNRRVFVTIVHAFVFRS